MDSPTHLHSGITQNYGQRENVSTTRLYSFHLKASVIQRLPNCSECLCASHTQLIPHAHLAFLIPSFSLGLPKLPLGCVSKLLHQTMISVSSLTPSVPQKKKEYKKERKTVTPTWSRSGKFGRSVFVQKKTKLETQRSQKRKRKRCFTFTSSFSC